MKEPGTISNVTFRNITAAGTFKLRSRIKGWSADSRVEQVTFENVRIGGERWPTPPAPTWK